jgi:hypothetical protein
VYSDLCRGFPYRFEIFTAPTNITAIADPTRTCFSEGGESFDFMASGSGISSISSTSAPPVRGYFLGFNFDENVTEASPFYYTINGTNNKEIKYIFCVKLTLTQNISGTVTDINFKQVAIQINVSLDGTLGDSSANAFEVDAGVVSTDTNNDIAFTSSADLCSTFNGNPTQGEAIPICIVSDNHPLARIVSVEDLMFSSGSFTQLILADGSAATGAEGLYGVPDPLNAEHCAVNKCIQYNVMLYAVFATTGANLDITIRGNVVLAIGDGTRMLRAQFEPTRALQDVFRERSFRSKIVLPALSTTESGAVSTLGAKSVAAMFSFAAFVATCWLFDL